MSLEHVSEQKQRTCCELLLRGCWLVLPWQDCLDYPLRERDERQAQ